MTEGEAIERMWYRIKSATDIVGKGIDGKAYEDMEMAISALEEIQQYRKIGTVDECRATVEKQIPKKPIKNRKQEIRYTSAYSCPNCGRSFTGTGIAKYCYHCGQALDWSDWSDKDV